MTDNTIDPTQTESTVEIIDTDIDQANPRFQKWKNIVFRLFLAGLFFVSGLGSGYFLWGRENTDHTATSDLSAMVDVINPKEGFKIHAKYFDVGPKLLTAGAIDLNTFEQLYQQSGQPLSDNEIEILTKGSPDQVVINRQNARFLLNFFWALGLTNKNPLLDQGPIQKESGGQIDRFASTGGWTIGTKPVIELFSSSTILSLSAEQQARVEEVASSVYRPCCNNPTHFPDCNHGMAMLGLLELMASQNATIDEMFKAAKSANSFWFPQQTLEQAVFFKNTQKADYPNVDAKTIVGQQYSSIGGFQQVHQWLADNGLLEQAPRGGNNCGV